MRRAAPGPQVSQGRIRVDAARAIRKLREYQLTDRAAWVLEAIRAAVAAGGTKIELRGDANDIWVGWHGTPWDPELLPRLFDELVSPEVADDKQHVRLLAAAVNSALGMNPAYVDVYTITRAGQGQRVRYTPEVLAEPENALGEAPLRHVAVEAAEPPTEISTGVLLHLRRRASLDVLQYWIGEPPELPLARAACRDIAVPLAINEDLVLQRDSRHDLVRVPLDDGIAGFVAITHEPVEAAACFEVAERGVVLARYGLEVLGFEARVPTNVRVFLDADRLPTNASRSQVRRDVHPIATAERSAKQTVVKAIEQLALLISEGPGSDATTPPKAKGDVAPKARAAALSLLAAAVGGHPVGWEHTPAVLAPLTKVPLARNAFGAARPIHNAWTSYIHTESSALDADLEPWLGEILWAPPGDAVHTMLTNVVIQVAQARRHVRSARQQRRAHKKFLAHAKREVKVQTSVYPRARVSAGVLVERSCVPQGVFADVTGEICVYTQARNAAVVLCVDQRELERVELTSAIAFDAVLDSNRLTPGERYRGVCRDEGFSHVDRALRAGVVRAVETIAAENTKVLEVDMPLIQSALLLAKELGFALDGPLTQAGVWRNAAGGYVSYADLLASQYIGLIAEAQTLVPPAGRLVVHADASGRDALRRLFGNRVVSYHKAVGVPPFDPFGFAHESLTMANTTSLAIADPHMSGVIAVATESRLLLRHRGVSLGDRSYAHELTPSLIVVDSDRILPNEKWTGVLDDGGLSEVSFRDWEVALLRAIASHMIEIEVPMLVTSGPIDLGHAAFEALATALLEHDPAIILGTELYERFCDYPLFEKLGASGQHSVRTLATENPQGLFYVTSRDELPLDEFQPVVASERIAQLLAKLSRRPIHDGKPELKARQRAFVGKQRLAALLAKPQESVHLASDLPTLEFRGKLVRGVIGLTEDRPHVRVHVENRPFMTLDIEVGFPMAAAVDLALAYCNVTLDGIPNLTQQEIIDDLRDAVPALIEAIANTQPRLLGASGPARRMLSTFLNTGRVTEPLRDLLCSVPAFQTIQGDYCSIDSVQDPPTYLMTAAYADEWLRPGEGDAPTMHDAPILRVAREPDELTTIIAKLHMNSVGNVTTDVTRLQARRRMALGLLPTPKLSGIPDNLKRPLKSFGELTHKLGHGEVGFAMSAQSSLLIHEQGMLNRTVEIDVVPAIQLAIESPHEAFDHTQITRLAQDLAIELVRTALPFDVPVVMRRNLARAVLANRVPPAAVGGTPLFQRMDGSWISWDRFAAQLEKYEDVWALTTAAQTEPLDPERLVLQVDAADIELANTNGYKIINAKLELELDAKTRENMARPARHSLELGFEEGVLATARLGGDGKTSPRGVVAVLVPRAAAKRGMYAHRAMHPFDRIDDVCRWPTIAVIDDARIEPDRTWSGPKSDDNWQASVKAVRKASEEALALVGDVPGAALAELRITNDICSDVKALREASRSLIRGVLWLSAVPFTPVTVVFNHADGVRSFIPDHGVAIGGALAVFSEDNIDIGQALAQLCGVAHARLVRMLLNDKDVDRDIAAAHIAHALAIGSVKPTEVNGIKFGCFAPKALEPRQLASLFRRRTEPVPMVKAGTKDIDVVAFADDGSEVAKVVRVHFGDRLTRFAPTPKPKPAPPPPPTDPPVSTLRPAPQAPPARKPAPPKKPHVLQPLADALSERIAKLGIQTVSCEIAEGREQMLSFDVNALVMGGSNSMLRKIAAALASESTHAERSLDALAAHAVSLLNLARTDITDGSEMHALGVLLATRPSGVRPQSRRS